MDPLRDTPLKRFGALWIGLFIALSFVIATLILVPFFTQEREDPILQSQYDARLETKAEVDKAQAEQLLFKQDGNNANVPPHHAFKFTAAQLLKGKAQKTSTVVPGSETALKASTAAPATEKAQAPKKEEPKPAPAKKVTSAQKPAPAKKAVKEDAPAKKNLTKEQKEAQREARRKAQEKKRAAQAKQNAENPE